MHLIVLLALTFTEPKTVRLDAPGELVSVAIEGKTIRLMIREALPNQNTGEDEPVVTADSSVRLNRRQAQQIADALDDAIRKAGGLKEETAARESVFQLVKTEPLDLRKPQWRTLQPNEKVYGWGAVTIATEGQDGGFHFAEFFGDHANLYDNKGFRRKTDASEWLWVNNSLIQPPHVLSVSTKKASPVFHLVSRPVRVCDGNTCRMVDVPDKTPARRPAAAPVTSASFAGRPRLFRRVGRFRCRGCR